MSSVRASIEVSTQLQRADVFALNSLTAMLNNSVGTSSNIQQAISFAPFYLLQTGPNVLISSITYKISKIRLVLFGKWSEGQRFFQCMSLLKSVKFDKLIFVYLSVRFERFVLSLKQRILWMFKYITNFLYKTSVILLIWNDTFYSSAENLIWLLI